MILVMVNREALQLLAEYESVRGRIAQPTLSRLSARQLAGMALAITPKSAWHARRLLEVLLDSYQRRLGATEQRRMREAIAILERIGGKP